MSESKAVSVPPVPRVSVRVRPARRSDRVQASRRRRVPGPPALRRVLLVALAGASLGLLAGCGSSSNGVASKSPTEILAAATHAADEASSVHLVSSSATGPLTSALNMQYASNGGEGHLSLLGLSFGVVRIGDTLYVNGNKRFYGQLGSTMGGATGAAIAKLPPGTWIKASATGGPLSQVGSIADKDTELALVLGRGTPLSKGKETSINGQSAIELKQAAKLYTGSLYIATTGKPYALLQRKTGREHGQTTFTNWDKAVTLKAPASSIDITQLEHGK